MSKQEDKYIVSWQAPNFFAKSRSWRSYHIWKKTKAFREYNLLVNRGWWCKIRKL